jgi:phytoene dehydrogenase-like protein
MSRYQYDTIIIGAGIAGLGVAAILAKEGRQKVLLLERHPQTGGRLMNFSDFPSPGWKLDVGLHFIELGPKSAASELGQRVGREIPWPVYSETVQFFQEGGWKSLAELVPMDKDERDFFRQIVGKIASLTDTEIEGWDNRSLEDWLERNIPQASLKELFRDMGMIMTTIPNSREMAAGECLFIARENLRKNKQVLASSYPKNGMAGLVTPLRQVLEENGGEIRLNCPAQEVIIKEGKVLGVKIPKAIPGYPEEFRIIETDFITAARAVCALPIYQLDNILDLNPETSSLPPWWIKRIQDIRHEVTGLVGYMIGLKEPITDRLCFFTSLKTPHAGLPFQGLPASNFDPGVAPPGKQLLHTDVVCDYSMVRDKFQRLRLLDLMWQDVQEMFPGIEGRVEWKLPYYVAGCDGLARKPGLVGNFKPDVKAPGIENLYFAGDTYRGRGLATNAAARSAMLCADLILKGL